MNAKQKAKYLFDKFYRDPIGDLSYVGKEKAKEFAKIVVVEILRSFDFLKSDDLSLRYWNQVLKEIDLL